MVKTYLTYILIISSLLLFTCCSENSDGESQRLPIPDYTWEEEYLDGPSATIQPFLPGNDITRSTLVYKSQKMVFGWKPGDMVGIFPTAKIHTAGEEDGLLNPSNSEHQHPAYNKQTKDIWRTNPTMASQRRYVATTSSSQSAQLFNNDEDDFEWDEIVQWTAYFPYKNTQETYEGRAFSFENQWQEGMVDFSAYRNGKGGYAKGYNNPYYAQSEEMASKHLGGVDFLISPEMSWNGDRINFELRHAGAILRFYLKTPEKDYVITKIQLICDKKIFHEKGVATLISHPYQTGDGVQNYGVDLDINSSSCQIRPVGEPTNNLTLNFYDDNEHQKAISIYDPTDQYKRYVIAYIMTYPMVYNPVTDGNLFAYVTAYEEGDEMKKECHFVSNPLEGFSVSAGHYYQLSSATKLQDGLYPIELTATLLPWQDIVGAGIDTDLTK